ncbi:MAG: VanZ family protein [Burkholderiaceae bacterium]|nr:VanZ family protein [Burkholderiaceae bacterium]
MASRGSFALAALAYAAFVVYGSLVPLEWRSREFGEALQAFGRIAWLDLGVGSRADWVANVLLFIPLAFLALGSLWSHGTGRRVLATLAVLCASVALSLAIEFAQLFFPQRTVSLNDLLAESIGALVGVLAWWSAGPALRDWLRGWASVRGPASLAERLLLAYLLVLFGYALLPLDLTISPAELFGKWREGRIVLVPFAARVPGLAQRTYDLASDIVLWVPAAFLWLVAGRSSVRRVFALVIGSAALLEFLQLFVYSRVSDVTDILSAGVGAAIGVFAARTLARGSFAGIGTIPGRDAARGAARSAAPGAGAVSGSSPRVLLWFGCTLGWLGVLATVFWYPFDFDTDWGFVHRRIDALGQVPLRAYYYGSEFRAVTEVLHKTGFFLPLGALLGLAVVYLRPRLPVPVVWVHLVMFAAIAGVAGAIEAGQLLLPAKSADPSDWFLETLGAGLGYVGLLRAKRALDRGGATGGGEHGERPAEQQVRQSHVVAADEHRGGDERA